MKKVDEPSPVLELVGLERVPEPLQAPECPLTKEFLLGQFRKSAMTNLFALGDLSDSDYQGKILFALNELRPTFLFWAANTWTTELFVTPGEPPYGRQDVPLLADVNPAFVAAVNGFQGFVAEINQRPDDSYHPVLEFNIAEVVYADALAKWRIPLKILGSEEHHSILNDFDPDNRRTWRFQNIYHDEYPQDPWGAGTGVPDFGKPETVFWFLATFERMYALGFRAFLFTEVQLMIATKNWNAEPWNGDYLRRAEGLKYTVEKMRNWALYGASEAPDDGRQTGDPIIVGCGEAQACAFPGSNPLTTVPRPLFDYMTASLMTNLDYMTDRDANGIPFVPDSFEQRDYQPWFDKYSHGATWHPFYLYPCGNPYSLPTIFFIDNSNTVDDITWFALLSKWRREYNLALLSYEFAKLASDTYFALPFKMHQGDPGEADKCHRNLPGCRICLGYKDVPCRDRRWFYEIYPCGELETGKEVYAWSDDIAARPEGLPKAVFWLFDSEFNFLLSGDLAALPANLNVTSNVRCEFAFSLGEWGPRSMTYLPHDGSLLIVREDQYWCFGANMSSVRSDSVRSLMVGCPPSCEPYYAGPSGVGATRPGLPQNAYAWERGGPDWIVCLPPNLAITGCAAGALIGKDGNVWVERGMCWGERTKMKQLLDAPGVMAIADMWPWAGKGPEAVAYLPGGADGIPRLLALRSGRYWLYNIPLNGAAPGEIDEPPLQLSAQGWLKYLLVAQDDLGRQGRGPNNENDLAITGSATLPDGDQVDYRILPWSGPVFGTRMLPSGPDILVYMANLGQFLVIKSLRLLNVWRPGEIWGELDFGDVYPLR